MKPCSVADPEKFTKCATEAGQSAIPYLVKGKFTSVLYRFGYFAYFLSNVIAIFQVIENTKFLRLILS